MSFIGRANIKQTKNFNSLDIDIQKYILGGTIIIYFYAIVNYLNYYFSKITIYFDNLKSNLALKPNKGHYLLKDVSL